MSSDEKENFRYALKTRSMLERVGFERGRRSTMISGCALLLAVFARVVALVKREAGADIFTPVNSYGNSET